MNPFWILAGVALILIALLVISYAISFRRAVEELERSVDKVPHPSSVDSLQEHLVDTLDRAGHLGRQLRGSRRGDRH